MFHEIWMYFHLTPSEVHSVFKRCWFFWVCFFFFTFIHLFPTIFTLFYIFFKSFSFDFLYYLYYLNQTCTVRCSIRVNDTLGLYAPWNIFLHCLKKKSVKLRSMIVLLFALLYVYLFSNLDIKCKMWHPCCLLVCAFPPLWKDNKQCKHPGSWSLKVLAVKPQQLASGTSFSPLVSCLTFSSQISGSDEGDSYRNLKAQWTMHTFRCIQCGWVTALPRLLGELS